MADGQHWLSVGGYKVNMLCQLGHGAFGVVYKAKRQGSDVAAAAKCITYKDESQATNKLAVNMAENETSIFRQLQGHRNVVTLLDHVDSGQNHWLIMEYCDLGDLQHYLSNGQRSLLQKIKIMYECTTAFSYMHSFKPPIVHRDIKPNNILITTRGHQHVAKITDFGVGKLYETDGGSIHQTMTTLAGTAAFMAPEFFAADGGYLRYKSGVDTFSLGLVFHVILNQRGDASPGHWDFLPQSSA